MKQLLPFLAFVLVAPLVQGQVIDDFSVSDPQNYTPLLTFGSNTATFATNGSGQLQPDNTPGSTTAFFRNTAGAFLSDTTFGESVSIQVVNVVPLGAAGLDLGTDTSGANHDEFAIYSPGANQGTVTGIGTNSFSVDFSLGSITETITRESDTSFLFALAGPGLTSTFAPQTVTLGQYAGQNAYFGLDFYGGGNPDLAGNLQIEDNLALVVPEPSTFTMLIAGAMAGGVFLMRRRPAL
jgi:hypothetical protein